MEGRGAFIDGHGAGIGGVKILGGGADGDAAEAEVLAKWLFLVGESEALASGITCVLVREDGSVRLGGDLS